ncbi:type II toxin-antitoxin system VapC family toxin [Aliirhizobium terrae]|uniref:type II toxin-antitoxin system VapC family toxin n=1 Tax=Terrirhizobium terrae TaxID=2926709 RepID=UPI002576D0C5|nr:type II toxin-antitoxin system VapC family toxin [Rhizobium sp. CC-CFT758]WJH41255.1 type II toxin-antitoxin system VapC family toxin [Rhizobium sp. CC-CFT758]
MFIDTSVIIALLADELDAVHYAERIERSTGCLTSGLVILEASMRLGLMLDIDPVAVEARIRSLLAEAKISVMPIDDVVATAAVGAFARYGKGRGHPAQLNLADCMSYACAKVQAVPLLFKGNDFSHTDITRG